MILRVCPAGDLPPGRMIKVESLSGPVLVCNVAGSLHAVSSTCTHAEVDLSTGWLLGARIACPAHGSAFDVVTGEALSPPADEPLQTFKAFAENGWVHVELPP